jgi:ubiquinone biosynthesis accessory factor UbiK
MPQKNFINDLASCLNDMLPPGVREVQKDMEKNIRTGVQATFAKLDLVTREEFDAQSNVLAKTRHKLEVLEKHVAELEKKRHPHSTSTKSHRKGQHKTD